MKKKLLIILLFILTGCTVTQYSYYPKPLNNINVDYKEYVYISTYLEKSLDEKSLIEHISVYDKRSNATEHHKIKILSSKIKLVSNGKEYIIIPNSETIKVYKQGVVITDDFKAYIGKVQLDNGTIIDIPPLSFKKTVYVEKYSVISDTINAGGRGKKLFSGTVEEYKKQKK